MAQEASTLEDIKNIMTKINLILQIVFADQLKAIVKRAASRAMTGNKDQLTIEILSRLLLQPRTAEELSSEVGSQQGVSRRTIQRRLEKLVETGVITMERRRSSVQYTLKMEGLV